MDLFTFNSYKTYVNSLVSEAPRGEWARISAVLRLHPSHVSQVFKGPRDLSPEQGLRLAQHLQFNESEKRFFLYLVQWERTGQGDLKDYFKIRLEEARAKGSEVESRISDQSELTSEQKAYFYSTWINSAIRLMASRDRGVTVKELEKALGIASGNIMNSLSKLTQLAIVSKNGNRYYATAKRTHIKSSEPQVVSHHRNWRSQTYARLDTFTERELIFTGPMMVARNDIPVIRQELLNCIQKISSIVDRSSSEDLACLLVDFRNF